MASASSPTSTPSPLESTLPRRRKPLWRSVVGGVVVGVLLAAAVQAYYVLLGGNFHTVVPGSVYRSAQPSAPALERIVNQHGVRTVINLRGCNETMAWYVDERSAAERLGVKLIDVSMWGNYPPLRDQLGLLVEALDTAEYPVLLHCQSGSDRAGLASALVVLLRPGGSIDAAQQQLALRYGHSPFGRAACHHLLLTRYREWLERENLAHTPEHLRRWIRDHYDRTACCVSATQVEPVGER